MSEETKTAKPVESAKSDAVQSTAATKAPTTRPARPTRSNDRYRRDGRNFDRGNRRPIRWAIAHIKSTYNNKIIYFYIFYFQEKTHLYLTKN